MLSIRRLYGRVVAQSKKGTFMSVQQSNLETVQAGLAQVAAELAIAEAALSAVALSAALDPAKQPEYDAALASLNALRSRRSLLQEAIGAAEAAEAARVDERSEKERRSKAKAFAAHLGNYSKHVAELAALAEQQQVAFSKAPKPRNPPRRSCQILYAGALSLFPRTSSVTFWP
jgi:hypothetical protein